MWYYFECYKAGHSVWTRKKVFADSMEEAAMHISEWCEKNGYADWALED